MCIVHNPNYTCILMFKQHRHRSSFGKKERVKKTKKTVFKSGDWHGNVIVQTIHYWARTLTLEKRCRTRRPFHVLLLVSLRTEKKVFLFDIKYDFLFYRPRSGMYYFHKRVSFCSRGGGGGGLCHKDPSPWTETPRTETVRRPMQRAISIVLECILVKRGFYFQGQVSQHSLNLQE